MAILMGIDIGTSSVKSMVMDDQGNMLGFSQMDYEIRIPVHGYAEQNPDDWWGLTCQTSLAAIRQAQITPDEIAGIGFSGQMHGLVALDADGKAVRPAIIWCDQRSIPQKQQLERLFSPEELGQLIQNHVATGFQLTSLLWVKENEPEVYRRIRTVILPKDYVRYRLTGVIGVDTTDASSTSAFDVADRAWSQALLERVHIDASLFPQTSEPWHICGTVTAEAAAESGLFPSTPVVFGGADQAMQAVGNGIVQPGMVSCTIGTGGQLFATIDRPAYDKELRTHTYVHATPDKWYLLGASMSAGLSLKWLGGQVLNNRDYAALDELARDCPAGSDNLLFLPYLAGDRTPHMDPHAKGAFFGLTLRHGTSHFVRSVLEGVGFSLKDSFDIFNQLGVKADKLIVSGGGAKSSLWKQIIADIFGENVYTSKMKEQACVGAAIMAGVGIGLYATVEEACRTVVRIQETPVTPNLQNREVYARLHAVYIELYNNNKKLFPLLDYQPDKNGADHS
ncbi:xylulokinase [Paenibacillus montanisoli]|uniref:Xylulose kinase n=1 Tax=Paenibacillus montanisoli TaxID=2081970 RepID=A0A328U2H5_9BACL|nr:xylulokinase [Paenibacillus montanisoli]RAP75983.1 xylulokinase [Paenibacillus montanisoli]